MRKEEIRRGKGKGGKGRRGGGEEEGEKKHKFVVLFIYAVIDSYLCVLTRDRTCNLGILE